MLPLEGAEGKQVYEVLPTSFGYGNKRQGVKTRKGKDKRVLVPSCACESLRALPPILPVTVARTSASANRSPPVYLLSLSLSLSLPLPLSHSFTLSLLFLVNLLSGALVA